MTSLQKPPSEFTQALLSRNIPLRMSFITSAAQVSQLAESAIPEFALVGRSNVGKSSLLNFVAGQIQLARVSSTPGRTQLINLFEVEKNTFYLADLPGYGFALSPRETQAHWQTAMSEYFSNRKNLVAVIFLMDVRRDINEEDKNLVRYFLQMGLSLIGVQTKCDKIHKSQLSLRRLAQSRSLGIPPGMMVSTSVEKKLGLQDLYAGISGILDSISPENNDGKEKP